MASIDQIFIHLFLTSVSILSDDPHPWIQYHPWINLLTIRFLLDKFDSFGNLHYNRNPNKKIKLILSRDIGIAGSK